MSVIFEISRDFPYQVALPFKEIAMEVLAWPRNARLNGTCTWICRRAWSATASEPRSTQQHSPGSLYMRRKGELSASAIDREWPHQVVLPARLGQRDDYNEIHEFCRDLTLCTRGHSLYHDEQWFHVYCFKEAADAHKFVERFGGQRFHPNERGRGSHWAKWKKA
jgi:hypothetical protein